MGLIVLFFFLCFPFVVLLYFARLGGSDWIPVVWGLAYCVLCSFCAWCR